MNTLLRLIMLEAIVYPVQGRGGSFRRGLSVMLILAGLYALAHQDGERPQYETATLDQDYAK